MMERGEHAWLFISAWHDERAGGDDAVRLRPEWLHYSSCFVGFNKVHFIRNNTLTTEQLGRATTKTAYISTARILHKWRHKHQFPVLFSEEVSLDTLWLCSFQRLIETSICGVHKLLFFLLFSTCKFPTTWISIVLVVVGHIWSVRKRLELLVSWCFTSTETTWLMRDGGKVSK